MKQLRVIRSSAESVKDLPRQPLATINWQGFPYCPAVSFSVGWSEEYLHLYFEVAEQAVLAEKTGTNQSVCQDSCVECFFSPRPGLYFNVEFNCIGTVLVGRGSCRDDSKVLPPEEVSAIRRSSSLGTTSFAERQEPTAWSLCAAIPFALLELPGGPETGKVYRANFYKCGDNLSVPHYVTWNPVKAPEPDFHRPECFGELIFE